MKKVIAIVLALVLALGLVACTSTTTTSTTTETTEPTEAGLKICIITSSGVDDGSFNQNCYEGAQAFIASHPDCTLTDVKEEDLNELVPTVEKLAGDYDVFLLPGFNFANVGDVAAANPDKQFIVIDSTVNYSDGVEPAGNVYTMTFKEYESGFFCGVAAACETKTGKVAVINGIAYPSNVNYEYGFYSGVYYANSTYGTTAEIVELSSFAGTDVLGNNVGGNYVGSFADPDTAKQITQSLIGEGVDIIFSACGSSSAGIFTGIKEANGVYIIGCDVDQYDDGANGDSNIVLTSSLKVMDMNVEKQLNAIYDGTFTAEDALLGADTGSTGIVTTEGRHQMSADTVAKLEEVFPLVADGTIVPAGDATSASTCYDPTTFIK